MWLVVMPQEKLVLSTPESLSETRRTSHKERRGSTLSGSTTELSVLRAPVRVKEPL
jgi:hypothetical protein